MRMQFEIACVDLDQTACAGSTSVYLRHRPPRRTKPGTANDWRPPWPSPMAMGFPRGCGDFLGS
jgi:hypothetical protein